MAFDPVPIGSSDGLAEHEGLFFVLAETGRDWDTHCPCLRPARALARSLRRGQPSSGRATPVAARPGVFPWPSHTVQRHPMPSVSIRIISHLSRPGALTQLIPTRYHRCCFHSLGGEEEVVRGPHRRGSGPAMRSRSPEEEGAGPGALPVAGRGQRGRSATRNKGEPAYPMSYSAPWKGALYYIGAGEGLRPFEPRQRGTPPCPRHHPRRGISGKPSTTTASAPPSERKSLRWLKSRATRDLCVPPELLGWRVGPTSPPLPPKAEIVNHSWSGRGRVVAAFDGGSITSALAT